MGQGAAAINRAIATEVLGGNLIPGEKDKKGPPIWHVDLILPHIGEKGDADSRRLVRHRNTDATMNRPFRYAVLTHLLSRTK